MMKQQGDVGTCYDGGGEDRYKEPKAGMSEGQKGLWRLEGGE